MSYPCDVSHIERFLKDIKASSVSHGTFAAGANGKENFVCDPLRAYKQEMPLDMRIFQSSKLFGGKSMATFTKPQQYKKEEIERLRGEGDQVKSIGQISTKEKIPLIAIFFSLDPSKTIRASLNHSSGQNHTFCCRVVS